MSEPPIIDAAAIANLRSLESEGEGGAFLRELVVLFAKDVPERLAELEAAVRSSNAPAALRAAHSIKGSSGNLGASALSRSAARLEDHLRQTPGAGCEPLVAAVTTEFRKARAELEKLAGP
jgi:HPt (histidine-containing phosphotransfer) domain-containing protein